MLRTRTEKAGRPCRWTDSKSEYGQVRLKRSVKRSRRSLFTSRLWGRGSRLISLSRLNLSSLVSSSCSMKACVKLVQCKSSQILVLLEILIARERVVPMLLACGKQAGTLTPQMTSAVFHQLIDVSRKETDASFLASLFRCISDSIRVASGPSQSSASSLGHRSHSASSSVSSLHSITSGVGSNGDSSLSTAYGQPKSHGAQGDSLPQEIRDGILSSARHQLQILADKRKARSARFARLVSSHSPSPSSSPGVEGNGALPDELEEEREDAALLEELEDFALDEAARLLRLFEGCQPLLVAVSSVKELGIRSVEESEDAD